MKPDPDFEAFLDPTALAGQGKPPSDGIILPSEGGTSMDALFDYGRSYEGASHVDRTMRLWSPPFRSPDGDILPSKRTAENRTLDTIRNDAQVMSGVNQHRDGIVGGTYTLNATPETAILKLLLGRSYDDQWEEEFQAEIEPMFNLIAESDEHWLDASGTNTLTAMARMWAGLYVMSGEFICTSEWIDNDPSRPCKTAFQCVDPARLGTPPDQPEGPTLRAGVRKDARGRAIGYYFRNAHPGDWVLPDSYTWTYVDRAKPWGRWQVMHIFEQSRPWQTRGIPDMVAALKETRMGARWRDTALQNAVLQATYAAVVTSDFDAKAVFERLGEGDGGGIAGMLDYFTTFMAAANTFAGGEKALKLDGVRVPRLLPSEKLEVLPVGNGTTLGSNFEASLDRHIAAALGLSTEEFSHNFSNTNYSSAKMATGQSFKYMQSRKKMVIDRAAGAIYRNVLEEALNNNRVSSMPRGFNPDKLYSSPLVLAALAKCEWIGAGRVQIDELKETQSAVLRMQSNLSTLEEENGRLGKDWRRVLKQRAREKKMLTELGLDEADQTNMMTAVSAATSQNQEADNADQPSQ